MTAEIEARRAWARHVTARCSETPPKYGSPEWLALDDSCAAKVAAVVLAAEAWAIDGDTLLERLAAEVTYEREAHKAAEDADYLARAAEHRDSWTGNGFRRDPAIEADVEREWCEWVGDPR